MPKNIQQLENVLEQLRKVAMVNPTNLAIYIAETNALIQISDYNFTKSDLLWFEQQVEEIIDIYLGGALYDEQHASYRETTQQFTGLHN